MSITTQQALDNCAILYSQVALTDSTEANQLATQGIMGRVVSVASTTPLTEQQKATVLATLRKIPSLIQEKPPITFFVSPGKAYNSCVSFKEFSNSVKNDPRCKGQEDITKALDTIATKFDTVSIKFDIPKYTGAPDQAAVTRSIFNRIANSRASNTTEELVRKITKDAVLAEIDDLAQKKSAADIADAREVLKTTQEEETKAGANFAEAEKAAIAAAKSLEQDQAKEAAAKEAYDKAKEAAAGSKEAAAKTAKAKKEAESALGSLKGQREEAQKTLDALLNPAPAKVK